MNGYLLSPIEFLVRTLFELYILAVMLRFLLQWVRADFYNPVCQFLVKITNPPLRPLRRVIPGVAGLDMAAVVLMLLLEVVAIGVVAWLRGGGMGPVSLLLWSIAGLTELAFNVFIFSIIIQAVLSWVSPGAYNPVAGLLYSLNAPLLRPFSRILPPISGIDLTPLFAILALQVAKMLIVPLLQQAALGVSV